MTNITVKKASEVLGVTPHYIRKLINEGKINGIQNKDNGRWVVERESLEGFRTTDLYKQDIQLLAKEMRITIKEAVVDVEDNFEANVISYVSFPGTPASMIDHNDCMLLDDLLYNFKDDYLKGNGGKKFKRICLFLHSGGGILESAIKFVDIIRQYSNEYHVVVPLMAKSAAALMVLMADKQYFTTLSELGPIDPIVQSPANPSLMVPATAIDNFFEYYRNKDKESKQTNASSSDIDPILLKKLELNIDPYLLGAHKTALKFSKQEIYKALKDYSMKNQGEDKIQEVVKEFTDVHASHGYPITNSTFSRYGIGEKIIDENQLKSVKMLMSVYQQFMANSNIVKLIGNREENKNITVTPVNPTQQIPTKTSL